MRKPTSCLCRRPQSYWEPQLLQKPPPLLHRVQAPGQGRVPVQEKRYQRRQA
jgi:hypothetical protein